ncbi:hypothetical protein PFNF54_04027 [Plasmodium falciparum NF54]|uniref:CS domain-containing protein n=1 Tax=Plasmodium falciparum (isolate NF54) TaxID=5843 RepID=W7JR44_PLAFO|nr:hypothetical protein PFNF54_04027 [Plasmodium falciparum NF54]
MEKEEIQFKENIIYVSAINKDGKHYELILNLLRPIIPENCSYSVLQKGLKLKVHKQIKNIIENLKNEHPNFSLHEY